MSPILHVLVAGKNSALREKLLSVLNAQTLAELVGELSVTDTPFFEKSTLPTRTSCRINVLVSNRAGNDGRSIVDENGPKHSGLD